MTAFKRWYAANGPKLSKARRLRYHSDAKYRQDALDRAKKQRAEKSKPSDGKTISFGEAAERVGVSTVTLRSWKNKDYFPEPTRHGRHLVFSESQVLMLLELKELFVKYSWCMKSDEARQELQNLVGLTYCNWE